MEILKIKNRNVLFVFHYPEWDLNLHLILGESADFLVDTGVGIECVAPVCDYLKSLGRTQPITVINTHYHWDHMWGNHLFPGRPIIAHTLCRRMADEIWEEMAHKYRSYLSGKVEKCLPNVLFENELYFQEEGIHILHTPGHSADCISILDEREGVLNVGDNIGDTPKAIMPELECSLEVYGSTLQQYKDLQFEICVSGHSIVLEKEAIFRVRR